MAHEDRAHLERIRAMPCCKCFSSAPSEPHHPRHNVGMGQKAHDHEAMPLCLECHRDLHMLTGVFKGKTRGQMRQWQQEQSDRFRPAHEADEIF